MSSWDASGTLSLAGAGDSPFPSSTSLSFAVSFTASTFGSSAGSFPVSTDAAGSSCLASSYLLSSFDISAGLSTDSSTGAAGVSSIY